MLGYIRSRIGFFILWIMCCGVFAVVFMGYSLPMKAVLYAGGLSLLISAAFLVADAVRYRKQTAELKNAEMRYCSPMKGYPLPETIMISCITI